MTRIAVFSLALLLSSLAHGKPTAEEVKHVIDFYYHGQDEGLILADVKLCEDVYTKGEQKNECMGERTADALQEGEKTNVWMMFMVPNKVPPQKIMLQLNHRGMTMSVKRTQVTSAIRYRTWEKIKFDRPGDWTIAIFHDKGEDLELIRELKLKVAPAESPDTESPDTESPKTP
jgi:hypothetical protein